MNYQSIAQMAHQQNHKSPYLTSSANDMAHKVGLWARTHGITPMEVRPSRGYTWILNREIKLSFAKNSDNPKEVKK